MPSVLLLLIALLPTQTTETASAFPDQAETFSREPRLGVLVLTTLGKELPGASLKLCRIPDAFPGKPNDGGRRKKDDAANGEDCRVGVADENGEHIFEKLEPAEYLLTIHLDGFVSSSIGPMSIAAEDPVAPDRVLVVLNAACYHC